MANEVASAYVALLPSFKGGAAAISRELGGPLDKAGDDGGKRFGGGMRAGIAGIASSIFAPLAAAAAGVSVVGFLKGAVEQASGLNEAGTALGQVFGDATSQVTDFASKGARALGQNQLAVQQAAQTFGVYGKAAGLASEENAKFSTDLVGLSTDLASFYNTDPSQAVEAIAAGLRGESEPLRQYGILLDDATLKARAMTLGIYDGSGSLTQQQRVLAAQAEIMAQSSVAQGDFARTSNGLANAQRILSASWDDLSGKVGALFLPIVTNVVQYLGNVLVPAITKVVDTFTAAGGGMDGVVAVWQQAVAGFGAWLSGGGFTSILDGLLYGRERMVELILTLVPQVVSTLAAALPEMVSWITTTAVPMLINTVMQIIPVIMTLVPTLVTALAQAAPMLLGAAVTVFGALVSGLVDVLPVLLGALVGLLPVIINALLGMVPQILTAALDLFTALVDAVIEIVPDLISALIAALPLVISTLLGMLPRLITAALSLFMGLVQGLVQALPTLLTAIFAALPQIISTLLSMLPTLILAAVELFFGLVTGLIEALPTLLDTFINVVLPGVLTTVVDMVPELIEAAITLFTALITALVKFTPDLIVMIVKLIPQIVVALVSGVGQLLQAGWDLLQGLWDGLVKHWPDIVTWFKGLPGLMLDGLGKLGDILLDAGRKIIQGLWNGLKEAWSDVADWFGGLGDWIADHKGPKSVDLVLLRPAGRWIMQGLSSGLEDGIPGLQDTLGKVTSEIQASGSISAELAASGGPGAPVDPINYRRLAQSMAAVTLSLDGQAVSQSMDERMGAELR